MIHYLSGNVAWGDAQAPFENPGLWHAIVCVADNDGDWMASEGYSARLAASYGFGRWGDPNTLHNPLRVWLPWNDYCPVPPFYLTKLEAVADMVTEQMLPVLVHCRHGGHRSPAAAILFEWVRCGRTRKVLDEAVARCLQLKPDCHRNLPYVQGLMAYCQMRSS